MNAYAGALFQLLPAVASRQKVPAHDPRVEAKSTPPQAIESPQSERDRIRSALVAAGLSLPASSTLASGQLTIDQREELARRISGGIPLSQIIIEERRGH
jgi:hypothetical protein